MRARQYSVATSKEKTVGILMRLVEKQITPYRKVRGLLSEELGCWSVVGGIKRGYFTKGKIKYEANKKYVLVGIGTGVAPLLSVI